MRKEIINRTNIIDHLIKKELEISGHTLAEAVLDSNWTFNFTLTMEQHAQFKKYCIPLLKKIFKFRRERAEYTFEFFYLNWGLRIKN